MVMKKDDIVSTLNELVTICRDGEEGFRTATESVKAPELKATFERYSRQRSGFAAELRSEVERLGEEAPSRSEVRGRFHRAWLNIRSAVQGGDAAAILAEAERGEDTARDAYREALSKDLPREVRRVIERQSMEVERAHDHIRNLRDEAKRRKAA